MLLKLEGAGSAQALQLPQGTGLTAALPAGPSSSAAAAAVVACKLGVGAGSAALPQVHSVLLQHLDLVPSGGGLEAAGLRFMQLQVRQHTCLRPTVAWHVSACAFVCWIRGVVLVQPVQARWIVAMKVHAEDLM
jgi:hypothetical protein